MLERIKKLKRLLVLIKEDLLYSLPFLKAYSDENEVNFARLRQSAHVLDKGLHIVPFEKGHGTEIYHQCKSLKEKITDESIKADPAFLWVESVIEKYEQAQQTGIITDKNISCPLFSEEDKNGFYKIILSRTSCRRFTTETIPEQIWNEIIKIASDAPSGCCRQTTRYYIEKDSEKIKLLIKNIAGATGFSGNFIPYLICITADIRPYSIKDRLLPYIDASLSTQNLLLACTVNNIYGTPLNFQHASKKEIKQVKEILTIPEYEQIILFIAVGKAQVLPRKPERMDIKRIRKK